jgi:hypothetical protein
VEVSAANWKAAIVWPLESFSSAALTAEAHAKDQRVQRMPLQHRHRHRHLHFLQLTLQQLISAYHSCMGLSISDAMIYFLY